VDEPWHRDELISIGVGVLSFRAGDPNRQTLLFTTLVFSQMALLQIARVFIPLLQTVFGTRRSPRPTC